MAVNINMTGDKRTKLRLKTKKSIEISAHDIADSKKRKAGSTENHNRRSKKEDIISDHDDIICLSDSDDEDHNRCQSVSVFDIQDDGLRKLRRIFLQIRQHTPLEVYSCSLPLWTISEKQCQCSHSREGTLDVFLPVTDTEYSPLPQMCRVCARRKPQHDRDLNSISNTNSTSDQKLFIKLSPRKAHTERSPRELLRSHDSTNRTKNDICPSKVFKKMNVLGDGDVKSDVVCEQGIASRTMTRTIHISNPELCESIKDRGNGKNKDSLASCPLCTIKFDDGTSQMYIDGHIAACLSAAGDDVVW